MLVGTYCGVVEKVNDPEKMGRVKVRVPHVYGSIGLNDLPWALPVGLPAGNSAFSGGISHLPEPGDQVFVRFLDGEPEKPIWEWGNQTLTGVKALKLHQYSEPGGVVGKPKRAAWTRYGHTLELNADSALITSSQGYSASFNDGEPGLNTGSVNLSTPRGNILEIDDDSGSWTAYVTEDVYFNVTDEIVVQARALDFNMADSASVTVGTSLDVGVGGDATLTAIGNLSAMFATFKLNAGTEPFVKGAQLVIFLESLLAYLTTHVHGNGNSGSPTTPPIVGPSGVVQPSPSTLVSQTIFGE